MHATSFDVSTRDRWNLGPRPFDGYAARDGTWPGLIYHRPRVEPPTYEPTAFYLPPLPRAGGGTAPGAPRAAIFLLPNGTQGAPPSAAFAGKSKKRAACSPPPGEDVEPPGIKLVPCGRVRRAIAGTYAVGDAELRRALGSAAFTLWQLLCQRRSSDAGTVMLTASEMGSREGWEQFPVSVVKKALVRLRAAGLVRAVGQVWRGHARRTVREVSGAPAAYPGQIMLSVPRKTAAWVTTAPGWGGARPGTGGARKGAGRPKGAKSKKKTKTLEQLDAIEVAATWGGAGAPPAVEAIPTKSSSYEITKGGREREEQSPSVPHGNRQEAPTLRSLNIKTELRLPSGKRSKPARSARRMDSPPGGSHEPELPSGAERLTAEGAQALPFPLAAPPAVTSAALTAPSPEAALPAPGGGRTLPAPSSAGEAPSAPGGAFLAPPGAVSGVTPPAPSSAPPPAARRAKLPGLPRPMGFVDESGALGIPALPIAPRVRVPEPPLLGADDGAERHVFLLAAWYTGAVEAAYGRRCWIFARGPVAKSKHVKLLRAAARVFLQHDIAPAAWVAWSIAIWREHRPDDFPPLAWIYGTKRIDERRGWFRAESTAFLAPPVRTPPAWQELRRRHAELLRALLFEPDLTPESAAEVIDCFLPRSLLDALLERARREAQDEKSELVRRVYCGGWVW